MRSSLRSSKKPTNSTPAVVSPAWSARATLTPSALAPTTTAVRRDSGRFALRRTIVRPSQVASHCSTGVIAAQASRTSFSKIVKAARRVRAQGQDREQHHPGREDVDRRTEQRLAEAVAPREGEREDEQAERQRRSIHALVVRERDRDEGEDRDPRLEECRDQRLHRLRSAEEGSLVGIVEHRQSRAEARIESKKGTREQVRLSTRVSGHRVRPRSRAVASKPPRRPGIGAADGQDDGVACARRPRPNRPSRCASRAASARELTFSLR